MAQHLYLLILWFFFRLLEKKLLLRLRLLLFLLLELLVFDGGGLFVSRQSLRNHADRRSVGQWDLLVVVVVV